MCIWSFSNSVAVWEQQGTFAFITVACMVLQNQLFCGSLPFLARKPKTEWSLASLKPLGRRAKVPCSDTATESLKRQIHTDKGFFLLKSCIVNFKSTLNLTSTRDLEFHWYWYCRVLQSWDYQERTLCPGKTLHTRMATVGLFSQNQVKYYTMQPHSNQVQGLIPGWGGVFLFEVWMFHTKHFWILSHCLSNILAE